MELDPEIVIMYKHTCTLFKRRVVITIENEKFVEVKKYILFAIYEPKHTFFDRLCRIDTIPDQMRPFAALYVNNKPSYTFLN